MGFSTDRVYPLRTITGPASISGLCRPGRCQPLRSLLASTEFQRAKGLEARLRNASPSGFPSCAKTKSGASESKQRSMQRPFGSRSSKNTRQDSIPPPAIQPNRIGRQTYGTESEHCLQVRPTTLAPEPDWEERAKANARATAQQINQKAEVERMKAEGERMKQEARERDVERRRYELEVEREAKRRIKEDGERLEPRTSGRPDPAW